MLLTGSFCRSLDEKQRFALPKPLRDVLGFPERTHLYLTPGTDRSVAVYTEEGLEAVGRQLSQAPPVRQDVRSFSRLFYAQASRVDIDRQGRIRIPSELVDLASIGSEIMLLGVRDHLEIWDSANWKAYIGRTQGEFDQLAEKAFAWSSPEGFPQWQPDSGSPPRSP